LAEQAVKPKGSSVHADNHLLTGRIFDEHGNRLTPVHATNHGKRYRYYVSDHRGSDSRNTSEKWRIPASVLERIVEALMIQIRRNSSQLTRWLQQYGSDLNIRERLEAAARLEEQIIADQARGLRSTIVRAVFKRVTVASH
jgi:hypothetical protein